MAIHSREARHGTSAKSVLRPPALRLVGVRKSYGHVLAVAGVDLTVEAGEFFTLLGPSGSGKTTLLRLIAGFESPDAGKIELAGRDVTSTPPHLRQTNTVFQDYALFPHMTVAENIGYGLRIKGIPKAERRERVERALSMVRLAGLDKRKPNQLSGGQRQRVAFARAVVNEPEVLLLDEPLGALDRKLRQEMQLELKRIQKKVGITFVYVTHDQEEALTMSDRMAVMSDGKIEQIGPPDEVYERPATEFVAGFIGISNVLERDGVRFVVRPETGEAAHARRGRGGAARDERRARNRGTGRLRRHVHPLTAVSSSSQRARIWTRLARRCAIRDAASGSRGCPATRTFSITSAPRANRPRADTTPGRCKEA